MIDIVDNGPDKQVSHIPDVFNVDIALRDAADTLSNEKQSIGDKTIDFVSKNFGTYRYNSALCRRDLRKIMITQHMMLR